MTSSWKQWRSGLLATASRRLSGCLQRSRVGYISPQIIFILPYGIRDLDHRRCCDLGSGGSNPNPIAACSSGSCRSTVRPPQTDAAVTMSTLELVDPELRDALALWPRLPLTADSLTQRRADLLKIRGG